MAWIEVHRYDMERAEGVMFINLARVTEIHKAVEEEGSVICFDDDKNWIHVWESYDDLRALIRMVD